MEINYTIPISEAKQEDGAFYIKGTAINAGVTGNNHEFTAEELSKSARTLKNVPLLEDHRNEVNAIRGRVINAYYDTSNQNVPFKARVSDENVQKLIKRNDLNSVSVGADVQDIEETENGTYRLKGVKFRELSLVAVGADEGASFATAVREAYKSKKQTNQSNENQSNQYHTQSPSGSNTQLNKYQEDKMSENGTSANNAGNEGAQGTQSTQGAQDTQNQATQGTQSTQPTESQSQDKEELKEIKESMKSMAEGLKTVTDELKSLKSKSNDESDSQSDEDSKKSDKSGESEESKKSSKESNDSDDEDEDEDGEEATESGKYRFVQGSGSLRGGAFTLIR